MQVIKLLFVPSGDLRRLSYDEPPSFTMLDARAREFFCVAPDAPLTFKYKDDESDIVTISTDAEVVDAHAQAVAAVCSLKLYVELATTTTMTTTNVPAAVHCGVSCDVTGMCPIVGPRYNIPGHDYDLCEDAYLKLDPTQRLRFVRIERPVTRGRRGGRCFIPPRVRGAGGTNGARAGRVAVHYGVSCDASGMCPIVGTRYHLPGANFDLCAEEYFKMDDDARAAFVAIEHPSPPPRERYGGRAPRRCGGGGDGATVGALGTLAAAFSNALDAAAANDMSVPAAEATEDMSGCAAAAAATSTAVSRASVTETIAQVVGACGGARGGVSSGDDGDEALQRAIASSLVAEPPTCVPPAEPTVAPSRRSVEPPAAPPASPSAASPTARPAMPLAPHATPPAVPLALPAHGATEEKTDDGFVSVSPPPPPPPPSARVAGDATPPPPATAAATAMATTRFDGELAELASLGFGDDPDRNLALLVRYGGRVFRVVNAILDMSEDN